MQICIVRRGLACARWEARSDALLCHETGLALTSPLGNREIGRIGAAWESRGGAR